MDDHLERFVDRARVDLEPEGGLSEANRRDLEFGSRAWLRGAQPTAEGAEAALSFLEPRLPGIEMEIDHQELLRDLFEPEAHAAVISELR